MKIFLDDTRNPKEVLGWMYKRIGALNPIYNKSWLIVKNYDEFKNVLTKYLPDITHISFDHDLCDEHYQKCLDGEIEYDSLSEKTGYDCAKLMKDLYDLLELDYPVMFVHSLNPVGTENIKNLFK